MDLEHFYEVARRNWHKPLGLAIALGIALPIAVPLVEGNRARIAATFVLVVLILCLWAWTNRYPRASRGKLGFAIALICDDKEQRPRVQIDFIECMRDLLQVGGTATTFDFIELPDFIARGITDSATARDLIEKAQYRFLIYGRVRHANVNGKEVHVCELDGAVRIGRVPTEMAERLSREFTELWPKRLLLEPENDLLLFRFTSEWTELVSRYIIGIAAFLSGDLAYAERLYEEVTRRLPQTAKLPAFEKIRTRLPLRLYEINKLRAHTAFERWKLTHAHVDAQELGRWLDRVPVDAPFAGELHALRAIREVIERADVRAARQFLAKGNLVQDELWHLNEAFLDAFEGDLRSAITHYRLAASAGAPSLQIAEVEDFMNWALNAHPDKHQYLYCLGFFNWQVRGDAVLAVRYFTQFVHATDERGFARERKRAKKWIAELEARGTHPV